MDRIPQDKINTQFKAMTDGLTVDFSEITDQTEVDSIFKHATQSMPENDTMRHAEWRAQSIDNLIDIHVDLHKQLTKAVRQDLDTLPDVKSWPIVIENIQTFTNYIMHTINDPQENDLSRATSIAELMVYQQEARQQIISDLIPSVVLEDGQYTIDTILGYIAKHNGLTEATIQLLFETFADGLVGDIEDALDHLRT
jgi:hypothetical protein